MKPKILLLFLLAISSLFSYAQRVKWAAKVGGSGNDRANTIVVDSDKSVYIGLTNQTGTSTSINGGCTATGGTGTDDAVYGVVDSTGACLYCGYISKGSDELYSIYKDASGNSYVTGYVTNTTEVCSLATSVRTNPFYAKYTSGGSCSWAYRISTAGGSAGTDIRTDAQGNVYIAGYFQGSATFPSGTLTPKGAMDGFLAKYNSAGTFQWVKQIGGYKVDMVYSVSDIVNGVFYITGQFDSTAIFGSDTLTKIGGGDVFIAKMDTGGNFLWAKKAGSNIADYGMWVTQDVWGNVFLSGITDSAATFGTFASDRKGDFLAKYDANGNVVWLRMLGKVSSLKSKQQTSVYDSAIVYVSSFDANTTVGEHNLTSNGGDDIYVAKLDYDGKPLWVKTFGGTGTDRAYGGVCDYSGNIYLTGVITGTVIFGSDTLTASGDKDGFILKLAPIYSITSAPATVCKGDTFTITFKSEVNASAGNIFTVQLSDSTGSFATVDTIGTKADTTAGSIACVVGSNIPAGSHYRIRIVSSNPVLTGEEWGRDVRVGNIPSAPTAPASQTICSDTAYTFTWDTITVGSGGDSIEWSLFSNFSYKNTIGSGSSIQHTVAAGNVDTIWLRSKVTATGCVSEGVKTWGKVNRIPQPPTPPAPVSVNSDTAYHFVFENIKAGYLGNLVEWALDSNFAGLHTDTPGCNISVTVSANSDTMIWLRNRDTATGCVSKAVATIAIVTQVYQRQPMSVDSVVLVCVNTSTYIKIPNTSDTLRYALRTDTGTVSYAMGNNGTLSLGTGEIHTNTFYTVLVTDTATGDTAQLGNGILISALGQVENNVHFDGDTLVYAGDIICYEASAMYGIKAIYSIASGSASVDSLTGCVYNITDTAFTLRATMHGPAGCGTALGNYTVHVTNVAPPIAPAPQIVLLDTPMVVTITFDSIKVGAGGDEIEWSVYPDFTAYQTINPYGYISINLANGMDTIIWLRSNNRSSGKKSRSVTTRGAALLPTLSAGLLDKSKWEIDNSLSDEFDYNQNSTPVLPNDLSAAAKFDFYTKWALNYCWGPTGHECDAGNCGNHNLLENTYDAAYVNFGNKNGIAGNDGSFGEVSFSNGMVNLKAIKLTGSNYPYHLSCNGKDKDCLYAGGMLCSRPTQHYTLPFLIETRCKLPSEFGAWPGFWLFGNNSTEIDIIDYLVSEPNKMNFGINDWAASRKWTDANGEHPRGCGSEVWKQTPCYYNEDFHTYSCVFSASEILFFIDGKEIWSEKVDQITYNFPEDITNYLTRLMIGCGAGDWANFDEATLQVDYIRTYKPKAGNSTTNPECLQNNAKTIEVLNLVSPTNNYPLVVSNTYNGRTRDIPMSKMAYSNESGLQKIFYQGGDYVNGQWSNMKCYNAYLQNGVWLEHPLVYWINDVVGGITCDKDRIYYYDTSYEIKFFQWVTNQWVPFTTGVHCKGSFNVDKLGRLFYIGQNDGNVYCWCPTGNTTGQVLPVVTDGTVTTGLNVHSCGCLLFYKDANNNIIQKSWWGNWRSPVTVAGNATRATAMDEDNSRLYYIGYDKDVHYYEWDYNALNTSGSKKLGSGCSQYDNAGWQAENLEDPQMLLALSHDKKTVFYQGFDSYIPHVWYYFNDNDQESEPNWYKSPVSFMPYSFGFAYDNLGNFVTEPWNLGKLFYVAREMDQGNPHFRLHVADWVDADNPVNCSITLDRHDEVATYKTDENENTTASSKESGSRKNDSNTSVYVYPNPSDNTFNFSLSTADETLIAELSIAEISGSIIFRTKKQTIGKTFVWQASNITPGVYFYQIKTTTGDLYTGKLLKY